MRALFVGVREGVRSDWPIITMMGVIGALLGAMLALHGVNPLRVRSCKENLLLYAVVFSPMLIARGACALFRARPQSPIRFLLDHCACRESAEWFGKGLPMLLAMTLWMPLFSAAKSAISLFHQYNWDGVLGQADRAIFGVDAWRVLQPVVGFPLVTSVLSFAYHAWIVLIYAGGAYFCFFERNRELRAQYFIARFLIWSVLGLGLATAFASVGPCFVGPLLGDHRYDELMGYLQRANEHYRVMVLPVQADLAAAYLQHQPGLGDGISAMPSMHVGMTLLSALAAWRTSRIAGTLLYIFLIIIALGSVHFGYHYAVDGLVSAVGTLALWAIAGWAARQFVPSPEFSAEESGSTVKPTAALA